MRRHFSTDLSPEASEYLFASARIRGISMSALVRRLLETIANDGLVLSILDDEGKQARQKGERGVRKRRQYVEKEYPL
jgi:hypothetical protein